MPYLCWIFSLHYLWFVNQTEAGVDLHLSSLKFTSEEFSYIAQTSLILSFFLFYSAGDSTKLAGFNVYNNHHDCCRHRDTNPPPLTLHCFCYQFMKFWKKSSSWRKWIDWRSVVISICRRFFETTDIGIKTTFGSKILKSFVLPSWRSIFLLPVYVAIKGFYL